MSDESKSSSTGSVFESSDFRAFLNNSNPSMFLSKDSTFDHGSVFNSKNSFSNLFASKEWEFKAPQRDEPAKSADSDEGLPKTFSNTIQESDEKAPSAAASIDAAAPKPLELSNLMKSRDWMPLSTLGAHVDVPYSERIFSTPLESVGSAAVEDQELLQVEPPLAKTQNELDRLFLAQLMPASPSRSARGMGIEETSAVDPSASVPGVQDAEEAEPMPISSFASSQLNGSTKKKRKRAPRKKVVPENKEYVEPTELDVLCGRGGRSNHHPGNKRYREEVENLKEWYNNIEDKDEKTDLSQCLINYVKSYGARFLEHDKQGWFVVADIVARRKASQALREDTDPEKRQAKRQRFLAKRARLQEEARRRGNGTKG